MEESIRGQGTVSCQDTGSQGTVSCQGTGSQGTVSCQGTGSQGTVSCQGAVSCQDTGSQGIVRSRDIKNQDSRGQRPGAFSMAEEFLKINSKGASLTGDQLRTYSPLSFAYIGDAVYELVIRTMIVSRGNMNSNRYHREAIRYVNASAQKNLMEAILPYLSEEEMKIYRRGQNAKPATTAKNQSRRDYHIATGFETLMGYLYLAGRTDRILELIKVGIEKSGLGRDRI